MDPAAERRDMKRNIEYNNSLQYVADSEYGIPTRCYCGGRMIDEVQGKEERDTLPGKRFFTCINYQVIIFVSVYFCFFLTDFDELYFFMV